MADNMRGRRYPEIPMTDTLLLTLLFVGNAVLFYLWASYVLKLVTGHCPHCGK